MIHCILHVIAIAKCFVKKKMKCNADAFQRSVAACQQYCDDVHSEYSDYDFDYDT